jgi:hypothetical protein
MLFLRHQFIQIATRREQQQRQPYHYPQHIRIFAPGI